MLCQPSERLLSSYMYIEEPPPLQSMFVSFLQVIASFCIRVNFKILQILNHKQEEQRVLFYCVTYIDVYTADLQIKRCD